MIDTKKINALFEKYKVTWFINISQTNSKTVEYSPLHNELSFDSQDDIWVKITLIKDFKKWVFSLDWFSLEKIEDAFLNILKKIELWEYDKDIVLPDVKDSVVKDFSNDLLNNITFLDLENELNKFINYKFDAWISVEWASIWFSKVEHTYINSAWSVKTQIDNSSYIYLDIVWENKEIKDNNYIYKSLKEKPVILETDIIKLQKELIFKITDSKTTLTPWIYDVSLDKDVVVDFLSIVLSNLSAEKIRLWLSLFAKNEIWDKIFWNNFTLINDPNLAWYTWNILFDWEWITQNKTILFKNWVLKAKFYDYKNALKTSLNNLWNSTISNIELVWNIDKDYLVWSKVLFTNLMAFHTVDEMTWKFSLLWEWYLLNEKWEKVDYIKNISLSSDIITLFSSIKSLWDDVEKYWNFKVPSVSFSNLKII